MPSMKRKKGSVKGGSMNVTMLLLLLATTCIAGSGSGDYKYFDSKQLIKWYEEHTSLATRHDKVPLVFNEEVLLTERGRIARSILFVVPSPYDMVKEKVSNAIAKEFGIKSTREYPWSLGRAYVEEESYVEKARGLGINLGRYIETGIISGAYNKHERSIFGNPKYYSELELVIADGGNIFQKPYSVIEIRRKDHWPDWDGGHHIIQWLPWKATMFDYIVTKREIEFIEGELNDLQPPFIFSYPGRYIISLCHYDFLTRLVSDLKKYDTG